jgi:hypothetical protein
VQRRGDRVCGRTVRIEMRFAQSPQAAASLDVPLLLTLTHMRSKFRPLSGGVYLPKLCPISDEV